ncbi:MAG: glycosyltransferase family 2 protein [Chlorogloeopsis fritschii C42_A2020_084]|uniref:glycosyltransferase family 2 protein n=1 Tax=Chlorogloeopsis fritschii TaxID=1124 RepID=UPI0019E76702|nr:glycosyltransferase family 2 protein [Chlorogloeopsis fritschii]MBF2004710.1 glycosyltransferase family 2 protein [Chlorogloeopsis fritschii C42_A2020_084]
MFSVIEIKVANDAITGFKNNFSANTTTSSMNKLLTIAIPTYNRAELLDRQLTWLEKAIKGFESECEIVISDNCSPDHTQEIIEKWLNKLGNIQVKVNRNSENIGVIKNIAYCINAATGKYVWTISDDDKIDAKSIFYLSDVLSTEANLSLVILNFSCRHEVSKELIYQRCFLIDNEEVRLDGKSVFEHCIQENRSGVQLMSAQIYKTELVQSALQKWPDGLKNLDLQVYLTAFCAIHGNVKISKNVYLENAFGASHWMLKPKLLFQMQYTYSPEVDLKLMEIGYSEEFCSRLILQHFFKNNWRVFLGALKRWPIMAIATIIPYLSLVCKSALIIMFPRKRIEAIPESIVSIGN